MKQWNGQRWFWSSHRNECFQSAWWMWRHTSCLLLSVTDCGRTSPGTAVTLNGVNRLPRPRHRAGALWKETGQSESTGDRGCASQHSACPLPLVCPALQLRSRKRKGPDFNAFTEQELIQSYAIFNPQNSPDTDVVSYMLSMGTLSWRSCNLSPS